MVEYVALKGSKVIGEEKKVRVPQRHRFNGRRGSDGAKPEGHCPSTSFNMRCGLTMNYGRDFLFDPGRSGKRVHRIPSI